MTSRKLTPEINASVSGKSSNDLEIRVKIEGEQSIKKKIREEALTC